MRKRYLRVGIEQRILKLAIDFCDESMIPGRYKPKKEGKTRKTIIRNDSKVEIYFQKALEEWKETFQQILDSYLTDEEVNHLLYLKPDPEDSYDYASVTECRNWNVFNDYLIYRRDEAACSDGELGKLSMLIGAYQKMVERKLGRSKGLKNSYAQELMEKGEVEIEGQLIKIWKGHTRFSVDIQTTWNQIKRMGEQNNRQIPTAPRVCFTGIFQIPGQEIFDYASALGFRVQSNVNSKTDLLVFGTENVGPTKIAEFIQRRESGQEIQLMDENAFLDMVLENLVEK